MRKLEYVKFHSIVFIPGLGSLGDQLPASGKTVKGLELWDDGTKVIVKAIGNRGSTECAIPHTNVQYMVYAPATEQASSDKAKTSNGKALAKESVGTASVTPVTK